MWLAFSHMFLVRRIGYADAYNRKMIALILLFMSVYTVLVNFLYRVPLLRYGILAAYIAAFCYLAWKYKDLIKTFLRRKKK